MRKTESKIIKQIKASEIVRNILLILFSLFLFFNAAYAIFRITVDSFLYMTPLLISSFALSYYIIRLGMTRIGNILFKKNVGNGKRAETSPIISKRDKGIYLFEKQAKKGFAVKIIKNCLEVSGSEAKRIFDAHDFMLCGYKKKGEKNIHPFLLSKVTKKGTMLIFGEAEKIRKREAILFFDARKFPEIYQNAALRHDECFYFKNKDDMI